jgi:xanthine dehydrogenase accessory factor
VTADIHKYISDCVLRNQPVFVATVVAAEGSTPGKPGFRMVVHPDGSVCGTIGGGAVEKRVIDDCLAGRFGEPRKIVLEIAGDREEQGPGLGLCGGTMEIFIEPLGTRPRLLILGAGHCGMALSRLARVADFHVSVYDDRPEWACAAKHPDADEILCAPFHEARDRIAVTADTYIVILTHGHEHDEELLGLFAESDAAYIGMIGSAAKVARVFDSLVDKGIPRDRLDRVHAPIGLDIGSRTAAEIAVSIAAELIAVRNGIARKR